jgi:hypothetical protein
LLLDVQPLDAALDRAPDIEGNAKRGYVGLLSHQPSLLVPHKHTPGDQIVQDVDDKQRVALRMLMDDSRQFAKRLATETNGLICRQQSLLPNENPLRPRRRARRNPAEIPQFSHDCRRGRMPF